MAQRHYGFLAVAGGSALPVGYFDVEEAYNRGWVARVAVFAPGNAHLTLGSMVGNALAAGIVPGRAVVVRLASGEESSGAGAASTVRSWPGIISRIEPLDPGQSRARVYCLLTIVDIVSYLSNQKVWGAYRAAPAGEIVGGVLSLAAGTSGEPTTDPVITIHPNVEIVSRVRERLDWIPFAIAAGQPLGAWLADYLGLLGIRMEMLGHADGSVHIILADGAPRDEPMSMSLRADETVAAGGGGGGAAAHGEMAILSLSARRGDYRRALLLDDPTQGQLRRVGEGPIGTVITGVEVSLDEAYTRAEQQLVATAAQLLVLTGESRQSGMRPGRRTTLDRAVRGITTWQCHTAVHSLRGRSYSNRALLLNGRFAWYPPRPQRSAPVVVPAVVDAGPKYLPQEPVPRDRLGRIPVSFPFAPMESAEDRAIKAFDKNRDGLLTDEDFAEELSHIRARDRYIYVNHVPEHVQYLLDTEAREQDVVALRQGDLKDPFAGKADGELDEAQLTQRQELEEKRTQTYRYLAWKRSRAHEATEGDYDGDDYLTLRDEAMSEGIRAEFEKDGGRRLYELSHYRRRLSGGSSNKTGFETFTEKDEALVREWETLFGDGPAPDWDTHVLRLDAEAAAQKWPPRVPLSIVQPMAGGLHGFVAAHRQGDACRVAVHDPLWAEIVGFEYRRHRAMSQGLTNATAGVVVEHDSQNAWSGMLFRRK